ncbi:MAG: tRNA (adenosine(37)-N6)-threonylcarbamoyltransferase complex ATPase subunit type 1 TsaE [Candidatus Mariimomonas ferrooxydans]
MYEDFFGLKIRPFSKTPDPKFLFYTRSHEEAFARLQHVVEEKELILLTGEVGSGKTTLSRALMDSLGQEYRIISILNPRLTPAQFLRSVAKGFDIDATRSKDDLLETIYEKVYEDYTKGITPVIIIDEAQLIPYKSTFEEIRLLTNFQLDEENLLSLILIGQPDLRKKLERKVYLPLRQRIGLRCHLNSLNSEEVRDYIAHRLRVAGRADPLFSEEAIDALYKFSQGIPRNINNIASNSLLEGFGKDSHMISEEIIYDVAHELGLNGVR